MTSTLETGEWDYNDDLVAGPDVDDDVDDDDVCVPELLSASARPGPNHPLRRGAGDGPPGLSFILRW